MINCNGKFLNFLVLSQIFPNSKGPSLSPKVLRRNIGRTVHWNLDGQCGLPGGCGGDTVDSLHNAVEGGVRPDSHVCPTEVVVDGAHQSHDVQVGAVAPLLLADATYKQ